MIKLLENVEAVDAFAESEPYWAALCAAYGEAFRNDPELQNVWVEEENGKTVAVLKCDADSIVLLTGGRMPSTEILLFERFPIFNGVRNLDDRFFSHTGNEAVRTARFKNRRHHSVFPIVVVAFSPERGLDAAYNDRHIGIEFLQYGAVNRHCPVWPLSRPSFRSICVITAQALGGSVMVHHRIHRPGCNTEKEPWSAQFPEVAQIISPVWLRNHRHSVAFSLEYSCNYSRSEGRMVDVGISRKENHVDAVPTESLYLFF